MFDTEKVKYFKSSEFVCKCCGENQISSDLVYLLDKARNLAGIPFRINCGYRCKKHNKEVGGVEDSSHCKGLAVDISADGDVSRFRIVEALLNVGFKRVLLYSTFIHCDIDLEKLNPILKIMK